MLMELAGTSLVSDPGGQFDLRFEDEEGNFGTLIPP